MPTSKSTDQSRLAGRDASIHPQRPVTLVLQRPVALGLPHDVSKGG